MAELYPSESGGSNITTAVSSGARGASKRKGNDYLRSMLARRLLQALVGRAVTNS
jgi:hypothetical protein